LSRTNASETLLKLKPDEAKFPLLLSFNFLTVKPLSSKKNEDAANEAQLQEEDEDIVDVP